MRCAQEVKIEVIMAKLLILNKNRLVLIASLFRGAQERTRTFTPLGTRT